MPNSDVIRIDAEFVDSNLDKRYPLVDYGQSPSGFIIPSSFLGDLKICIGAMDRAGSDSYRYNTYISEVRIYPDYIYVDISMEGIGKVATSAPIPTKLGISDTIEDRTIIIRPTSDLPINGTLVIGTCSDMNKYPGAWTIAKEEGLIFPANIIMIPTSLTGIIVGDKRITGDIVLEAGDNIDITYDESTNTITFSVVPESDAVINDETLLRLVTDKYGAPIISVNGVSPDNTGNISIMPTDCLMVEVDARDSIISFYNPCGATCASEEFMSDTYNRIDDLNRSVSALTSFYASVSNTLAQMAVRVSSVLEPKKAVIESLETS